MWTAVRQTLRTLLRTPAFTVSAVVTLALGIAATTLIFSTVYHMVMRPLPFDDWRGLGLLMQERNDMLTSLDRDLLVAVREHATTLEQVEIWSRQEQPLTGEGEPLMLAGAMISEGLPSLLRVAPLLGRSFTEQEVREGARVVMLGERLWRSRFDADRSVLGRTVRLGDASWTVIGVMPARFHRYDNFGESHEFWTPLQISEQTYDLNAMVRLREGVTAEAVTAEVEAMAATLPRSARGGEGWSVRVRSAAELATPGLNAKRILPRLLGAALLLLLIGCANVAGLLLIRVHARGRELAVRSALGAHRSRLVGELAIEQVLLAAAAGGLGLIATLWGLDLIRTLRPEQLSVLDNVSLDAPVLGFTMLLVLGTTLLFGALPAVAVLRRDLAATLQRAGGPRLTSGTRARSGLVIVQIALSTMLLAGGFLLVRTVNRLDSTDLGFDPQNVLVAGVPLPRERYEPEAASALLQDLTAALREQPNVQSVAVASGAPPQMGLLFVQQLEADGSDVSGEGINFLSGGGVSPGFFETIGARFLEGRDLTESDTHDNAVVTRAFVDRFWPGESGVGKRFRIAQGQEWRTIVGVVDNMRHEGPVRSHGELRIFWAHRVDGQGATLLVRTAGDPLGAAPAVREILARLDPHLPIRSLSTLEQRMAGTVAAQRFNMVMLGLFAASAVLLCAVGLYGLIAYSLQQRVREIGVRVALGASPRGISALFMSHAARLTAAGVVAGLLGAVAASSVMAALVHDISPRDPLALAAACAVACLTVLPAGWLPARRAARIEPLEALRSE